MTGALCRHPEALTVEPRHFLICPNPEGHRESKDDICWSSVPLERSRGTGGPLQVTFQLLEMGD